MDVSKMELPENIKSTALGMLSPGETLSDDFMDLCKRVKKRVDRVQGGKILNPETVALIIEFTAKKSKQKTTSGPPK